MLDDLEKRNWVAFLDAFARRLNPWMGGQHPLDGRGYYWTMQESEYATDVMFTSRQALARVYPALVRHVLEQFSCRDMLRFPGARGQRPVSGPRQRQSEASPGRRPRKTLVDENSIKMYDKQGSVLRVETTINNPRRFKVRRAVTRNGERTAAWIPMRKSVADIRRRVRS